MKNLSEVVAVYFPSYHRDELYDRWYGDGWNEWRLLEQARPLFAGHEQPKLCTWGSFDEADPVWKNLRVWTRDAQGRWWLVADITQPSR